jgi:predicted transcriptional regulator of viral defense system
MTSITLAEKLLEYIRRKGIVRAKELNRLGIPTIYLTRLVQEGRIERVNRGLYRFPDAEITEHFTLVQAAKKIPNGVVCLLSALSFHEFTTQLPHQIWIAVERGKWEAGLRDLPIRIFEFSGKAFNAGIEKHRIEGGTTKVYCLEKTVADCFKYRNKIGLDVAMEALRECRRERRCKNDDLWHYAKICRVANVMRPYLEAMA